MSFPQWTLVGMGLSILGALLLLAYSLYVQSPSRQLSYQIEPYLRESRVRMATTVAFALLLLTVGFYVAGVPLSDGVVADVPIESTNQAQSGEALSIAELPNAPDSAETQPSNAPSSGAFNAPLAQDAGEAAVTVVEDVVDLAETAAPLTKLAEAVNSTDPTIQPTNTPIPTPSNTPTATPIPTQTPTPLPTATPTPTLTPTPITDPTAQVSTGGSTLWVKRSPGGQNLVILHDGDTVILLGGNANQAGILWKEVKTVEGVRGWVQAQFLDLGGVEEEESE